MEVKYYMSTKVCVSGGFDPLHIGHIELIEEAAKYGPVLALVNCDQFLMKKKGYIFMPENERLKMVQSIKGVEEAHIVNTDGNVAQYLKFYRPKCFVNGGDRNNEENMDPEEVKVCKEYDIKLLFVGSKKTQSSSKLCENLYRTYNKDVYDWIDTSNI